MRSASRVIIAVQNLTHIYHPGTSLEKKALEDISFEICAGEGVAIVGETGSGKTTLIQHLNGLLKPNRGFVWVEGADLSHSSHPLAELRKRVGLLFQYPEHQLFEETVFEDISFVLRQHASLPPQEIQERVKMACTSVGLDYEKFRQRSPFELSGGEMRRVALAGVLIQDPKILILDEPTVGLDFEGKREILREIDHFHRGGKTILMVSHLVEDLLSLVDRIIVLDRGRICAVGTPEEVFSFLWQKKKLLFLVPPIFQLAAELRTAGWDIPSGVLTPQEALKALRKNLRPPANHPPHPTLPAEVGGEEKDSGRSE